MIAVGIDVSKSKSTVAILDSYGALQIDPFDCTSIFAKGENANESRRLRQGITATLIQVAVIFFL